MVAGLGKHDPYDNARDGTHPIDQAIFAGNSAEFNSCWGVTGLKLDSVVAHFHVSSEAFFNSEPFGPFEIERPETYMCALHNPAEVEAYNSELQHVPCICVH